MFRIFYICFVFAIILGQNQINAKGGFSYEGDSGVNAWPVQFPAFCNGKSQSPIDLADSDADINTNLPKLKLGDYLNKDLSSLTLTNNGHTVQGSFDEALTVSGGPLDSDSYKLKQFHLHFGKAFNDGSEHTLNGKGYALEIHFVHQNTKYDSLNDAIEKPDGLMVIGIFGKINDDSSSALNFITDNLDKVQNSGDKTNIQGPFNLATLIPNIDVPFDYFTYKGSLTTPTCNEAVTWIVNKQALSVSNEQVQKLRGLLDSNGNSMAGNVRPTQPLNNRPLTLVTSK